MLKIRIIPTLLWKDLGLVKGIGFNSWRRVGPILPAIKVYNARDVDELILVDITASQQGHEPDVDTVKDLAEESFVPFTVGGGISELNHIQALLHSGADKITLNSIIYSRPEFVYEAAKRFGSQCIVVSIDVRCPSEGQYVCYSHAGTRNTGKDPVTWAKIIADQGAGEILLTSIERDGTMQGYDLKLIESVVKAVSIPVIASGGAGNYQHMVEAVTQAGASAVAAASIFHYTEQTPAEAKDALKMAGVPVRKNYK